MPVCARCWPTPDFRSRLSVYRGRVGLVAGAADPATPPATLEALGKELADSERHVLDGVGHVSPVEAPTRLISLANDPARTFSLAERSQRMTLESYSFRLRAGDRHAADHPRYFEGDPLIPRCPIVNTLPGADTVATVVARLDTAC